MNALKRLKIRLGWCPDFTSAGGKETIEYQEMITGSEKREPSIHRIAIDPIIKEELMRPIAVYFVSCTWDDVVIDVDAHTGEILDIRKRQVITQDENSVNTSPDISQDEAKELYKTCIWNEYSAKVGALPSRLVWAPNQNGYDEGSTNSRLVW